MKNLIFIFVLGVALNISAQIKHTGFDSPSIKEGIINQNSGNLFSFLNSENFSMTHAFNLSYSAFGGEGLALGVYTNTMAYKFSDKLNVQTDISIVQSPYSSFGKNVQNNINGLYLSRAAINYKPFKDMMISIQYRNLPGNYYNNMIGGGFYSHNPFNNNSNDDFFWGY